MQNQKTTKKWEDESLKYSLNFWRQSVGEQIFKFSLITKQNAFHSYQRSSDQTAATAEPTMLPTEAWEFHIPIIRPLLKQQKQKIMRFISRV